MIPIVVKSLLIYLSIALAVPSCLTLEGYDCDRPMGIRTYSARDVETCQNHDIEIKKITKPGQVLQKQTGRPIDILRCKVTTDFVLANCGAYGHVDGIFADFPLEIQKLSASDCRQLVRTLEYNFRGNPVQANQNTVTQQIVYLKGSANARGDSCTGGGEFTYAGYTLYDAVVPVSIVITLNQWQGYVDTSKGKVIVNKLFSCTYSDGYCADDDYGTVVWDVENTPCSLSQFVPLYTGPLTWFNASVARGIVIENKDRVAVLRPKEEIEICGLKLIATSLEDIFISDIQYHLPTKDPRSDLFGYFETKLDYVFYKNQELNSINLAWIAEAICKLERQAIKLKLNLIAQSVPGQHTTLGEPGVAYVANGEVIYQLLCTRVNNIELRDTESCYQALPVRVPAESNPNSTLTGDLFLEPLSRVLLSASSEAVCSRITPFAFQHRTQWFIAHPERTAIIEPAPFPLEFKPPAPSSYVPLLPSDTIYSAKDVQELSRALQIPAVREATVMSVVRRMNGLSSAESYDISKGFTTQSYDNIFQQYFDRVWGVFSSFGQAMSGVIGIWILVKLLGSITTTLFNCSAIYKTTGLSFKLLGAFFTTLTSFFIVSESQKRTSLSTTDTELEKVTVTSSLPGARHAVDAPPVAAPMYPNVNTNAVSEVMNPEIRPEEQNTSIRRYIN